MNHRIPKRAASKQPAIRLQPAVRARPHRANGGRWRWHLAPLLLLLVAAYTTGATDSVKRSVDPEVPPECAAYGESLARCFSAPSLRDDVRRTFDGAGKTEGEIDALRARCRENLAQLRGSCS